MFYANTVSLYYCNTSRHWLTLLSLHSRYLIVNTPKVGKILTSEDRRCMGCLQLYFDHTALTSSAAGQLFFCSSVDHHWRRHWRPPLQDRGYDLRKDERQINSLRILVTTAYRCSTFSIAICFCLQLRTTTQLARYGDRV